MKIIRKFGKRNKNINIINAKITDKKNGKENSLWTIEEASGFYHREIIRIMATKKPSKKLIKFLNFAGILQMLPDYIKTQRTKPRK